MRYSHFEDLVEAVSKMLERYEFYPVRQRTMQENLKFMQSGEGYRQPHEELYLLGQGTSPS